MNQHFLYNILNHIQYFINRGERDASLRYISRLSRLLRQWMDGADGHTVSAASEAVLLQNYLELESLRFPGRFTFDVDNHLQRAAQVFLLPHIIFPLAEQAVQWIIKQEEAGENHIRIALSEDGPFIKGSITAQAGTDAPARFEAGVHLVPHPKKQPRPCNALSS